MLKPIIGFTYTWKTAETISKGYSSCSQPCDIIGTIAFISSQGLDALCLPEETVEIFSAHCHHYPEARYLSWFRRASSTFHHGADGAEVGLHRKKAKYEQLVINCCMQGWEARCMRIEAGCRGLAGHLRHTVLKWQKAGKPRTSPKQLTKPQNGFESKEEVHGGGRQSH